MEDILYCKSSLSGAVLIPEENALAVIQTLCDAGRATIGGREYPITYGGLYYLRGEDGFTALPHDEESYEHSMIVFSAGFLSELSELLECTEEIDGIFAAGGLYVPVKNYKTIDERFKRMAGTFSSGRRFSKALVAADLLQLINYAVYARYH